ncbi:PilZ domain-containing protein [Oceanisphaera avium]|uniref:PilZ domain-containing protein n=1 Tax=Oceanisphaera avium TaxID=1903694 RepID=A0A1Y0CWC1_9GAMM|nr:PilZ domain-containing protein [Oceanisphaera avium]ART79602.1 hypothetical protein CBP12_05085 [Oceanisphaera avium]
MPGHPYLSDDELTLLSELFQEASAQSYLTLPLQLDKEAAPLIKQASGIELRLTLGEAVLTFPVLRSAVSCEQSPAQLSTPHIISHGGQPRSWRLPAPQHIHVKHANGKPLAAEIRDLSINGMRLLSRRALFSSTTHSKSPRQHTLLLTVGEETLRCVVTLVREHKGPAFWMSAVKFELNEEDQQTLLAFVFEGFLAQIKKQAPAAPVV